MRILVGNEQVGSSRGYPIAYPARSENQLA